MVKKNLNLTPYRTFRLCNGDIALDRRINLLLNEIVGHVNETERKNNCLYRPNTIAEYICIWPTAKQNLLTVRLWPGVKVEQARRFFNNANQDQFMDLGNHGWKIVPNLRISRAWPICETKTNKECEDYWEYFAENQCQIGQHNADGFMNIVNQWQQIPPPLLTEDDMRKVNDVIENEYNQMNISPGFELSYDCCLDTIIEWENKGSLVDKFIDAINEVLQVWGEPIE